MNLLKIGSIFKNNKKNDKKQMGNHSIDIFLLIAIFLIIASPVAFNIYSKIKAEMRLVNLYVSSSFEEIFGKEKTEVLLYNFNELHQDIRVRVFNNLDDIEPDVIIYDRNQSVFFEITTALANLNQFIKNEDEPYSEILAIPLVNFMDVLFFNIDILTKAGFDRPPRTRGEYIIYSRTAGDLGFYSDNIAEPENNLNLNEKMEAFVNGQAAMIVASTRAIPELREKIGDDIFGITAIPYATDGTVGRYDINLTGIYAGISKKSTNQETAWNFINFLSEQRASFCEMFKAVPGVISDVIPGDYVLNDPFYSRAWDIFEYNKTDALQH